MAPRKLGFVQATRRASAFQVYLDDNNDANDNTPAAAAPSVCKYHFINLKIFKIFAKMEKMAIC